MSDHTTRALGRRAFVAGIAATAASGAVAQSQGTTEIEREISQTLTHATC